MLMCVRKYICHMIVALLGFGVGVALEYISFVANTEVQSTSPPPSIMVTHSRIGPGVPTVLFDANRTVADHMRQEIRILCWIMTGPKNHRTKAQHIRHTWGRHCNTLLFMTSIDDPDLENSIPLPVAEGRDSLWPKTREAFRYIYEHHRDDADWFLKADDDSYVVMENLRAMLHPYPPEIPIFFGRKFKLANGASPVNGYMSGGAGYVLSKRAMDLFVEKGLTNATICFQKKGPAEDAALGRCMEKLGVVAGNSQDHNGLDRFFPLRIFFHLFASSYGKFWYHKYNFYPTADGVNAIPQDAVSFHYVTPKWMYLFDYALYNVRTYGSAQLPRTIDETKFTMKDIVV